MYESPVSLPHLCPTEAYFAEGWYLREQQLLSSAWYPVADRAQLARDGDFVTVNRNGQEIQIRNFQGEVRALSNVCAHRHCLISSLPRGNSPSMQCQYHGWEYGSDGYTRKIPGAKEFAPIDRQQLCVPVYATQWCGQLLFLKTSLVDESLPEFLGPLNDKIEAGFGQDWKCTLRLEFEYPTNWKVPIENSLEAYHVPMIHANTFVDRPDEARTEHRIDPEHTSFHTRLPFAAHSRIQSWFQRFESRFVQFLGRGSTGNYNQHHVFPNLLCSFTDAISLCHSVVPLGPTSAKSTIWQFGLVPSLAPAWKRWAAMLWGKLEALITHRILVEDLKLYPAIQRGLEASQHLGRLARSEERIYAFQKYLVQNCGASQ